MTLTQGMISRLVKVTLQSQLSLEATNLSSKAQHRWKSYFCRKWVLSSNSPKHQIAEKIKDETEKIITTSLGKSKQDTEKIDWLMNPFWSVNESDQEDFDILMLNVVDDCTKVIVYGRCCDKSDLGKIFWSWNNFFKWAKPSFFSRDRYNTNLTINDTSIGGVLGTRTRGGRMVGAHQSTELWWQPSMNFR